MDKYQFKMLRGTKAHVCADCCRTIPQRDWHITATETIEYNRGRVIGGFPPPPTRFCLICFDKNQNAAKDNAPALGGIRAVK